jgi:hypothetical protein
LTRYPGFTVGIASDIILEADLRIGRHGAESRGTKESCPRPLRHRAALARIENVDKPAKKSNYESI